MTVLWSLVLIIGFHTAHPQEHTIAFGMTWGECFMKSMNEIGKYAGTDSALSCRAAKGSEA
jgi:hypothetical protein